jgi:hypothetical protein
LRGSTSLSYGALKAASKFGVRVNIISDSNSATYYYRSKLHKLAKNNGYKSIVIYCSANIEVIKSRNWYRKKIKGIKNFYITSNRLKKYIEELEVPRKAVIVDTTKILKISKKELLKNLNKWIQNIK